MTAIIGQAFEVPFWAQGTSTGPANFSLNSATDALETVFQAAEDMTITRVGFRQATVTGTSPAYKASLQGVDSSGNPDGTILGGGSPASVTFTPVSGGNSTFQWKDLDNSIAVTRGQWLALRIAHDSGTIDGSNCCSFSSTFASQIATGSMYAIQNDAGSRARQTTSPLFGYGTSSRAYGLPGQAGVASSFSSASTPDERGNRINFPTDWYSTYKIVGMAIYAALAAGGAFDLVLYSSDGTTVLQDISIDADNDMNAGQARRRAYFFNESVLATLSAGTDYFLTMKPTSGSFTLYGMTMASTDDLDAYLGGAAVCEAATKTDGGAFTLDNTSRYAINPILADITAPSGGGGGACVIGE